MRKQSPSHLLPGILRVPIPGATLALVLMLSAAVCAAEPAVPRPNLIFFFIDTLRADRCHCYGYPRPTTPVLDEMAAQGVLFENAVSQASWSLPSYATLFTGLYPPSHGVTTTLKSLGDGPATLAGILSSFGYETTAFVAGGHLSPSFRLNRGFASYQSTSFGASLSYTASAALTWLDRRPAGPFFMIVHGYDVHCPYTPPLGFGELYDPEYTGVVHQPGFLTARVLEGIQGLAYDPCTMSEFEASPAQAAGHTWRRRMLVPPIRPELGPATEDDPAWPSLDRDSESADTQSVATAVAALPFRLPEMRARLEPADVRHLEAHYDGGLTYADTWLGVFREGLQSRGLAQNTVLVVLGDHGEELGEHGRFGHGHSLYDGVLHVPLVMTGPGLAAGRRVRQAVELIDLAPTALGLASVPAHHQHQGGSLLPLVRVSPPPAEDADHAGFSFDTNATSVRTSRWHLISSMPGTAQNGEDQVLYDLEKDPTEKLNAASGHPEVVARLRGSLAELAEKLAAQRSGAPDARLTPGDKQFLKQFGYW